MKVQLISYTPEPEKLVATSAKLCYSKVNVDELQDNLTAENVDKFLKHIISLGHKSPLEHVSFTFAIEGVSRSLTHQLVRHRIASYSQQSQRYVNMDGFEFVVPKQISDNKGSLDKYNELMDMISKSYSDICELLKQDYMIKNNTNKIPKSIEKEIIEDVRYILPNACETKIIVTMNVRSLLNFFEHRCCMRAQWEIRNMAYEMLKQVKTIAPILFSKAGASCAYGKCKEGTMSCGRQNEIRVLTGIERSK